MTRSFFWGDGRLRRYSGVVATGYVADTAKGAPRDWPHTWAGIGANGVVSSAEDLVRFGEALSHGVILSRAAQRDMYTAPFKRYSAGWDAYRSDSGRVVSKGGSGDYGFHAQLRRHLADDTEIAVLFNAVPDSDDEPHQTFGPRISTIVLGVPFAH
jgi:CubicO group peptidase (beta-lactamase class C family)